MRILSNDSSLLSSIHVFEEACILQTIGGKFRNRLGHLDIFQSILPSYAHIPNLLTNYATKLHEYYSRAYQPNFRCN